MSYKGIYVDFLGCDKAKVNEGKVEEIDQQGSGVGVRL